MTISWRCLPIEKVTGRRKFFLRKEKQNPDFEGRNKATKQSRNTPWILWKKKIKWMKLILCLEKQDIMINVYLKLLGYSIVLYGVSRRNNIYTTKSSAKKIIYV